MPPCATLATVASTYKPRLPPGMRDRTFNPSGLSPMGGEPDPYTMIADNKVPHLIYNPRGKSNLTGPDENEVAGGIGFISIPEDYISPPCTASPKPKLRRTTVRSASSTAKWGSDPEDHPVRVHYRAPPPGSRQYELDGGTHTDPDILDAMGMWRPQSAPGNSMGPTLSSPRKKPLSAALGVTVNRPLPSSRNPSSSADAGTGRRPVSCPVHQKPKSRPGTEFMTTSRQFLKVVKGPPVDQPVVKPTLAPYLQVSALP